MISRRPITAPAAVGAALLLAGCGGAGTKPRSASRHTNSQLALAACMRAHGVTNFPDPTVGPGGAEGFSVSVTPGSSIVTIDSVGFSGPAFTSAERACKLFGGGTAPPPISASQKQHLVAFARCMRKHGVSDFADPTFSTSGGVNRGGAARAAVGLNAPVAQKAVQTCKRLVPRT